MMLSGPSAARDAKNHAGLLIMVKGRSKPIRPTNVTLFVLLSLIYRDVHKKLTHLFYNFHGTNVARMNLRIPHDSAIDGILFNRRLNYAIPTSQSQQGIFEMVYFSGERSTDEVHLQMNRRTSTHNCRYRTAAVPEHRRSLCTIT